MNELDYLQNTLSEAKALHTEALNAVEASRTSYNCRRGSDKTDGSVFKMQDMKRIVQGALPSLVEPFVSGDTVSVTSDTAEGEDGALAQQLLLNEQWKKADPLTVRLQ